MKKMGLARQLWLLLLLPIAFALGTYGFVAHQDRHRILLGEASAELRNHGTLLEAAVAGAAQRGELQLLEQRIGRLARADRILGIAVFNEHGESLLVTEHLAASTSQLSALARFALEERRDIEEERRLASGPALVRTVLLPRSSDGKSMVAVVARDLNYLDALAATLDRGLLVTTALLLAFTGAVAAFVTSHTVGRPVQGIVRGASRVASGELDVRVSEAGSREIVSLAQAFNRMTLSLGEARDRAERDEAARVALEHKLRHAQALAAVGQVAASIAHEIGSPLNVILGRAQRAADHTECSAAIRTELQTIARQSERITKVVTRLLDVARPPTKVGSSCELSHVVAEVLAFLAPECKRRAIATSFSRPEEEAFINLGADATFQVVCNLCLNAIEAQPDGGRLKLRIVADAPQARRSEPHAVLEVVDRGAGIPPDIATKIFDPFFTTKSERGGSGLGLAIVSGIMREAGGAVRLTSNSARGTCFAVDFPLATRDGSKS